MDAGTLCRTTQTTHSTRLPIAFWALLILAALIRTIGITRPLLGNFSTKSVMYAMIARNWVEGRAGVLYPTLDCMVGGQRALHMLEFSVSAYLTGALWMIFGGSLDVWGRATAVAFSLASVALLFLFVRRRHGSTAALGAGFVLALSPISIIYGQNFMLDASLLFFTVATFYLLDRWLHAGPATWLVAAAICFALLLLTKVYMLVLLFPLAVMVVQANRAGSSCRSILAVGWLGQSEAVPQKTPEVSARSRLRTYLAAAIAGGLAVLPIALWCLHALRTASPAWPLSDSIYSSLQGNADVYRPPDPLLWTPDFYRQLLDDLTGVILTPIAFMLLLAGFLNRSWRQHWAWLLAIVFLVLALPLKFYLMNYYYMAILAPLCLMAGLGWQVISERLKPGRVATAGLLAVALVISLRYAAKPAFITPDDDRAVVAAGRAIQELTEPEEPVVTMHGAAIDLLYYSNRPGWAIEPDAPELGSVLEACRRQGARYLVMVDSAGREMEPAELRACVSVLQGDGFCIYELVSPVSD